jgi:tape measure domain-containing protein
MNLETLVLELVADDSQLSRDIDSAVNKAMAKLSRIERAGAINPKVNAKALHDLNKLLDVKQDHLSETVEFYKKNPIVIGVDTSEVDEVKESLKELREEREKNNHSAQSNRSTGGQGQDKGYGSGTLFNEVEQKLTGEIKKVVNKFGDIATAPLAGIGRGFFEGFGQTISKELSEGFMSILSQDLNVDLKDMGKKAADSTISYAFPNVQAKKKEAERIKQYQSQMDDVDDLLGSVSKSVSKSKGLDKEKAVIDDLKQQSKTIKENLRESNKTIGAKGIPSNAEVIAMGQQVNLQIDAIAKLSATLNAVSGQVSAKLKQYRDAEKLIGELSSRLDLAVNSNDYKQVRQIKNDISSQLKTIGDVGDDPVMKGYRDRLIEYQKGAKVDSDVIVRTTDNPTVMDYLTKPKQSVSLMAEKGKLAAGDLKGEAISTLVESAKAGVRGAIGIGQAGYKGAKAIEQGVFSLDPMGMPNKAKGAIQTTAKIAIPTAAFAGISQLPGGHQIAQLITHLVKDAIASGVNPLEAGFVQTISGLVREITGVLPSAMGNPLANAIIGNLQSAIQTAVGFVTGGGAEIGAAVLGGQSLRVLGEAGAKKAQNKITEAIAPSTEQPKLYRQIESVGKVASSKVSKLIEKAQNLDAYLPTLPANQRKLIGEYLPKAAGIERANQGDFMPQSVALPGLKQLKPAEFKQLDPIIQSTVQSDWESQYKAAQKVTFEFLAKMRGTIDPLDRMKGDIASLSSAFKAQVKRLEEQGKGFGFDVKKYKMDESAFKGVTLDADAVEMPDITKIKASKNENKKIEENWEKTKKAVQDDMWEMTETAKKQAYPLQKNMSEGSPGPTDWIRKNWDKTAKFVNQKIDSITANSVKLFALGKNEAGRIGFAEDQFAKIYNPTTLNNIPVPTGNGNKIPKTSLNDGGQILSKMDKITTIGGLDLVSNDVNNYIAFLRTAKSKVDKKFFERYGVGLKDAVNKVQQDFDKSNQLLADQLESSLSDIGSQRNDVSSKYNAVRAKITQRMNKELAESREIDANNKIARDEINKKYDELDNGLQVAMLRSLDGRSQESQKRIREQFNRRRNAAKQNRQTELNQYQDLSPAIETRYNGLLANVNQKEAKEQRDIARKEQIAIAQNRSAQDELIKVKEQRLREFERYQKSIDAIALKERQFRDSVKAKKDKVMTTVADQVFEDVVSINEGIISKLSSRVKRFFGSRNNDEQEKRATQGFGVNQQGNQIGTGNVTQEVQNAIKETIGTDRRASIASRLLDNIADNQLGDNPVVGGIKGLLKSVGLSSLFFAAKQGGESIYKRADESKLIDKIRDTAEKNLGEGTVEYYDNFMRKIRTSLGEKTGLDGNLMSQIVTFAMAGASTFTPQLMPAIAAAPLFMPLVPPAMATLAVGSLVAPVVQRIDQALLQQEPIKQRFITLEGTSELGEEKQQKITDIANKYSIPVEPAVQNFSQMAIAAQNTNLTGQEMMDLFEGISASIRALGLSTQDADLIFMAYTQMLAKGRISMEELRQQLGERFPPAMSVFAKALDTTTAGLDDMVSRGAIGTEKWVTGVTKVLKDDFGSVALSMGDNYAAASSRLENINFKINKNFADTYGGLFTFVKNTWGNILNFMADNFKILNALAVSGLIAVWASIGIGLSFIMKTPAIANMAKGGSNLLLSAFKNSLGTLTPFIIGTVADIVDDLFGTQNNVMENMSRGVGNMFVAGFTVADRYMRDADMGAMFDPFKESKNIFEPVVKGIESIKKAIPGGVIEMLSLVFMFEQVRVLANLFLVPTFKNLSLAVIGWGKAISDAVVNMRTMKRTMGDLMGGTLIAVGGVKPADVFKQYSNEFKQLRIDTVSNDLKDYKERREALINESMENNKISRKDAIAMNEVELRQIKEQYNVQRKLATEQKRNQRLNQYKQDRNNIIEGFRDQEQNNSGNIITRQDAIKAKQQELRELKRLYQKDLGSSPENDSLVRYESQRDELLNRRMKQMAAKKILMGGAMLAAEAGLAVAMMAFARSDFSNTVESESNKARKAFIGSVDAMKVALKTLEEQGAKTGKTISSIKLPSKGLELNLEAIFMGRSEKSFKSDDLINKINSSTGAMGKMRDVVLSLSNAINKLPKLPRIPFVTESPVSAFVNALIPDTSMSEKRIAEAKRLGVSDYYIKNANEIPTLAKDQFLDSVIGFDQEYKNAINQLSKGNTTFDVNDLTKPLSSNALNALNEVKDIDAKMKAKQDLRMTLGLENTAQSRAEVRKLDQELNDLLKTRKELAKPFIELDSFSKDLESFVKSQTDAINNSGWQDSAKRAAEQRLEPLKQLSEEIKNYFAGQGITQIAKPLEDVWDRVVNKIQDVESALNRVKAVNAIALSKSTEDIYNQGGGSLIVNRKVQETTLEGAKKDYAILAKTLRENEQALAEALSISNVGDSSEKRSKIEELRGRVREQSVELANAGSSIAKAKYDLTQDFGFEDYYRNTARQVADLKLQIESQQIQDQRSLQDLGFQLADASVSLRRSNRALAESYQDMAFDFNVQVESVGKAINDAQDQLELTQLRINNLSITPGNSGSIARQLNDIMLRYTESVFSNNTNERQIKIDVLNLEKERIGRLRQIREFEEKQRDATRDFNRQVITLNRSFFDLDRNMKQAARGFIRSIQDMTIAMNRADKSSAKGQDLTRQLQGVPSYNPAMILPLAQRVAPPQQAMNGRAIATPLNRPIDPVPSDKNNRVSQPTQSTRTYSRGDIQGLKDFANQYGGFAGSPSEISQPKPIQQQTTLPVQTRVQSSIWNNQRVANNPLTPVIVNIANRFNVPAEIALAMASQETGTRDKNGNPIVGTYRHTRSDGQIMKSPSQDKYGPFVGTMQVGWGAAKDVGYNPNDRFDVQKNIEIAMKYVRLLYEKTGDWRKALAAYNAGLGNLGTGKGTGYANSVLNMQRQLQQPTNQMQSLNFGVNPGEIKFESNAQLKEIIVKPIQNFLNGVANFGYDALRVPFVTPKRETGKSAVQQIKKDNPYAFPNPSLIPPANAQPSPSPKPAPKPRVIKKEELVNPANTTTPMAQRLNLARNFMNMYVDALGSTISKKDLQVLIKQLAEYRSIDAQLQRQFERYVGRTPDERMVDIANFQKAKQQRQVANARTQIQSEQQASQRPLGSQAIRNGKEVYWAGDDWKWQSEASYRKLLNNNFQKQTPPMIKAQATITMGSNAPINNAGNVIPEQFYQQPEYVNYPTQFTYQESPPLPQGFDPIGSYESAQNTSVGGYMMEAYQPQDINPLLAQVAHIDKLGDKLNALKQAGVDAQARLNVAQLIDSYQQFVNATKDGLESTNRSVHDANLSVKQLTESSKGWLTITQKVNQAGQDVASQYENQIRSISDSIRDMTRLTDGKEMAIANLEVIAKAAGYSEEQKQAELDRLETTYAQYDQQIELLEASKKQLETTKGIAQSNAQNRAYLQEQLALVDGYVGKMAELSTAKYNLGGTLVNDGAILQARLMAATASKRANIQADELSLEGDQRAQYVAMAQEIADINLKQSFSEAVPFVKELGANLKEAVFQTNNFTEALTKTLDVVASTLFDRLVMMPFTNFLAEQASNLFGYGQQAIPQLQGSESSPGFFGSLVNLGASFIPQFANGLDQVMAKESAMTGRKPMLAVVNDGEAILSTLNGDAQKFQALKRSGNWDKIPNFANGSDRLFTQSRNYQGNWENLVNAGGANTSQSVNNSRTNTVNKFNQTYVINTPNADSFRKSQSQIQDEGARTYRRKMR